MGACEISLCDAMVNGVGETTKNPVEAIEKSYAEGVTDEFLNQLSFQKIIIFYC